MVDRLIRKFSVHGTGVGALVVGDNVVGALVGWPVGASVVGAPVGEELGDLVGEPVGDLSSNYQVFQLRDSSWVQLGQTLYGSNGYALEVLKNACSLNDNGIWRFYSYRYY